LKGLKMKVPAQDKRFVGWADSSAHADRFSINKNMAKRVHVSNSAWANKLPILLLLLWICAIMLTVGCGPQQPPNVKKARAIAAENIELRKELERRNNQIETLKEQYGEELEAQKKRLKTCLQEKEELKEKSRQNIRDQVKGVLDTVLEENRKLREENTRLKAQIEVLQKKKQ
jgi:hypothetical protein